MDKLQELEKKYKELGEEIEKLKNQGKVWKPKENERFYTVAGYGSTDSTKYCSKNDFTRGYEEMGNCFKSKREAEAMKEKIQIYTELKRLAEEINTEPIDWEKNTQTKYYICYRYTDYFGNSERRIQSAPVASQQDMGVVYSANKDFLKIAKERIGEDRLLKLFKEN